MTLTPKAEATRRKILETGTRLVLGKGFAALGLQEILKASGVPKGSFYHYFPSKEAFGCALLEAYVADYAERLDRLTGAPAVNGRERLMRYWRAWIEAPAGEDLSAPAPGRGFAEDCLAVRLAAEVADLSEDMRRVLSDGVSRLIARIAGLIGAARADGSLPQGADAAVLARMLYQMWLGAALVSRLSREPAAMEEALVATERLLSCPAPAVA